MTKKKKIESKEKKITIKRRKSNRVTQILKNNMF